MSRPVESCGCRYSTSPSASAVMATQHHCDDHPRVGLSAVSPRNSSAGGERTPGMPPCSPEVPSHCWCRSVGAGVGWDSSSFDCDVSGFGFSGHDALTSRVVAPGASSHSCALHLLPSPALEEHDGCDGGGCDRTDASRSLIYRSSLSSSPPPIEMNPFLLPSDSTGRLRSTVGTVSPRLPTEAIPSLPPTVVRLCYLWTHCQLLLFARGRGGGGGRRVHCPDSSVRSRWSSRWSW